MIGVSCFALFILFYGMGFNPLGNISWLSAWVPVLFICRSTKAYRENELEGYISYGQAYKTGFLTAVAGGLLSALLIFLFCSVYDSAIIEDFKNQTLAQMDTVEVQMKSFMGETMYEQALKTYEQISLQSVVTSEFFNKVMGGIIVSLISAAIYKREKPILHPPVE